MDEPHFIFYSTMRLLKSDVPYGDFEWKMDMLGEIDYPAREHARRAFRHLPSSNFAKLQQAEARVAAEIAEEEDLIGRSIVAVAKIAAILNGDIDKFEEFERLEADEQ